MRMPWVGVGVAAVLSLCWSRPALADSAAAEALYQQGKQLGEAGDWRAACPKFLGSYKLDKQLGTLLNLANCRAQEGRVATAWARYNEALEWAQQRQDERTDWIIQQRDRLAQRLPRLVVEVIDPVPTLTVWRGDQQIIPETYGVPLPLDPGTHTITIKRGELSLSEQTVTIAEKEERRIEVNLAAVDAAHAPPPPPPPPPPSQPEIRPKAAPYDPTQRTIGFVVGGVGGAAVLAAGGFGLAALAKRAEANAPDACVGSLCSPRGLAAAQDGAAFADASQWLGIGGLAVLAVGATVLLTAPSADTAAVTGVWLHPLAVPAGAGVGAAVTF